MWGFHQSRINGAGVLRKRQQPSPQFFVARNLWGVKFCVLCKYNMLNLAEMFQQKQDAVGDGRLRPGAAPGELDETWASSFIRASYVET